MTMMDNKLDSYRKQIDSIDKKLMELFEERMDVSKEIGMYKYVNDLPIHNEKRELENIQRNNSLLHNQSLATYSTKFLKAIMEESKDYQHDVQNKFKYGLLGQNISYSLSPSIHQQVFNHLDKDYIYGLIDVEKQKIDNVLNLLRDKKLLGINVTIPFKESVFSMLDQADSISGEIGAVNTIKLEGNQLVGYNTDYYGFSKMLVKNNINVANKHVTVLGTGGACKMVLAYLVNNKAASITVVSRSKDNIALLQDKYHSINGFTYDDVRELCGDIIINTTPLGMNDKIDDTPMDKGIVARYQVAIDLIYNPWQTRFIFEAKMNGLKTINGWEMLVYQAIEAQRIWQDEIIYEEDIITEVSKEIFKNRNIVLIGMPGSGKTTVSTILAQQLNMDLVNMDKYIEENSNSKINDLFANGERTFRDLESLACKKLAQLKNTIIDCGGGVVEREENMFWLASNGIVILLDRNLDETLKTIDIENRPLLKDNPEYIYELKKNRAHLYKKYSEVCIVNDGKIDKAVELIKNYIEV